MAHTHSNFVDISITSSAQDPMITWCTTSDNQTHVFQNSKRVPIQNDAQKHFCLLTTMAPNTSKQIKPTMAALVKMQHAPGKIATIKKGNTTFTIENAEAEDYTQQWQNKLNSTAENAMQYFRTFVTKQGLQLDRRHHVNEYCNPLMMEADMFLNGDYSPLSTLSGWPQCARIDVSNVHFLRSVVYACVLTKCDLALVATHGLPLTEANVLITVCLTAFAGNYPVKPELVDDRTCGSLKLNTNRDCDDMAITVCAVFNALKKQGKKVFTDMPALKRTFGTKMCRVAELVLNAMLDNYGTALAVVCEAKPHIANPNIKGDKDSAPIGHVFAVLCRNASTGRYLFRGCLVIESTRASSPHATAMDKHTINGTQVFCRTPVYDPSQHGIQCVKPFIAAQYPFCMAAYSADTSYLLANSDKKVGVPIQDLIDGTAQSIAITDVPSNAQYCSIARQLCHCINYDTLDEACNNYNWPAQLGIKKAMALHTENVQQVWTHAVDPVCQPSPPFFLNNWTVYGFFKLLEK